MTEKRLMQTLLAAALTASVVGVASVFLLPSVAVAACAGTTALLCATALAAACRRRRPLANEELVEKAAREAETGRKLVIYERTTGLLAHWYLAMRADEECARAARYDAPLALAALEPQEGSNEWALQGLLTEWLAANLRASDLVGYIGNGRFLVLMIQTNEAAAEAVLTRLRNQVANVETGLSVFPADGTSFGELYPAAHKRLRHLHKAA
jgi:GGDEF domain-containing protein